MTMKIAKSVIDALGFDFPAAAAAYAAALTAHLKTEGEPAPIAPHHLVAQAVTRSIIPHDPAPFRADFEVVDDTPPPAPPLPLAERKQRLSAAVTQDEAEAYAALTPPGKTRLHALQESEVLGRDQERRNTLYLRKVALEARAPADRTGAEVAFLASAADLEALVMAGRPEADATFMATRNAGRTRHAVIDRWAAEQLAAIEDLTEETIGAWKMAEMPRA